MTCPFDITVATNSVRLDAKHQGEATFTVFNRSGRPVRGRGQLAAQQSEAAAWLAVSGENERNFAIAGAEQYSVRLTVPKTAPAGNYAFRLDMVGVENPDEEFCAGPSVTFVVPEPAPPKPFPWWIVAVVAVVVIGAGLAFWLWPRSVPVPDVREQTLNNARATLEAVGLASGGPLVADGGSIAPGLVVASTPGAATPLPRNGSVVLVIADEPTPTPTPSPTSTHTPTPEPTVDLTATAQAHANATATALAASIGKYTGTWEVAEEGSPYITTLRITRDGETVDMEVAGLAYPMVFAGGVGSALCVGASACTWGEATTTYSGDPLQAAVNPNSGLDMRLTLTAVDGSTLAAVFQIRHSTTTFPATSFLLKRARPGRTLDDMISPLPPEMMEELFVPSIVLTPIPIQTLIAPNLDLRVNPELLRP